MMLTEIMNQVPEELLKLFVLMKSTTP
jgi:hypothetical protein